MNTAPKAPSVVDELDEAIALITEKRDEAAAKLNHELQELEALRAQVDDPRTGEEVRTKVRAARRRTLGAEDVKRSQQLKTQDVRVRMRVPADMMAQAAVKVEKQPKQGMSKIVVQGSIQRELSVIDSRIVELFMDDHTGQAPELVFLSDLRAGLAAVLKDLPEHGVLLGLVSEHVDTVQATLRDLGSGGVQRAKRFFEHDRELLGRLKAMLKADGSAKTGFPPAVDKLIQSVGRCKLVIDTPSAPDLGRALKELEEALVAIHKELQERGFVAARSLLFSALR